MGIQNGDIATLAELTARGAGAPQLPNDTKIYDTKNEVQLSVSNRKNNDAATAEPTATDDASEGYESGSRWIFNNRVWTCVSNTNDAAVWTEGGGGSGSGAGSLSVFSTIRGDDYDEDSDLESAWARGSGTAFRVSTTGHSAFVTRILKTSSPISGTKSIQIKFSDLEGIDDDWVSSPAESVPLAGRGGNTLLRFVQTNNIDTAVTDATKRDDIRLVVVNASNNSELHNIPFPRDEKFVDALFYIPSDVTQIAYGIYNDGIDETDIASTGIIIEINDLVLDYRGLQQASFTDFATYRISQSGNQLSNRSGETRFNLATASINKSGKLDSFFSVDDDSTGTRTRWTALRKCTVTDVSFSCITPSAYERKIGINGVPVLDGSQEIGNGHVSGSLELDVGDYITVGLNTNSDTMVFSTGASIHNTAAVTTVSMSVAANNSDAYAFSASGVENNFSARIQNNGVASVLSNSSPENIINGASFVSTGRVEISFKSGFFKEIPSIVVTADVVATADSSASVDNVTTSGCTVYTSADGVPANLNFNIFVSSQGSDRKDPTAYAMFANNVKSSAERQIGWWFGQPLYERSFKTFVSLSTIGGNADLVTGLPTDLTAVSLQGIAIRDANTNSFNLNSVANWFAYLQTSGTIHLNYSSNIYTSDKQRIIFQYTKNSEA
ncbi:MAG: hypothetical protein K0U41_06260 [Gammaproteobacteria bacterium]|nr:hypothetical protein [Gammaproteobacteria bacterium]